VFTDPSTILTGVELQRGVHRDLVCFIYEATCIDPHILCASVTGGSLPPPQRAQDRCDYLVQLPARTEMFYI
jgi:hypothetical protein